MLREISQPGKTSVTRPHLYVESNEQNKTANRIETEAWMHGRLTAVRGERAWRSGQKVKGFVYRQADRQTDSSVVTARGKEVRRGGEGRWGWQRGGEGAERDCWGRWLARNAEGR